MNLTERERTILRLARQELSDYKIARKISTDPPSVTRSHKNAHRKLMDAVTDLEWASKMGVSISNFSMDIINGTANSYSFFL
jgi:DNA-binding CsgD family transcriptional regulator